MAVWQWIVFAMGLIVVWFGFWALIGGILDRVRVQTNFATRRPTEFYVVITTGGGRLLKVANWLLKLVNPDAPQFWGTHSLFMFKDAEGQAWILESSMHRPHLWPPGWDHGVHFHPWDKVHRGNGYKIYGWEGGTPADAQQLHDWGAGMVGKLYELPFLGILIVQAAFWALAQIANRAPGVKARWLVDFAEVCTSLVYRGIEFLYGERLVVPGTPLLPDLIVKHPNLRLIEGWTRGRGYRVGLR